MKKIYIILTHTGTNLSKLIKSYTKDEFSHVSIALDSQLKEMYSFGRLHPYNPFWAGFVHEYIDNGTFKRFYNTKTRVYSLEVTQQQYASIKNSIQEIEKEKEQYTFNILGLFAAGIHIRLKYDKSFYCAEFVKYVLDKSKINTNLPDTIKPEDFKKLEHANAKVIYTGLLREYRVPKTEIINIEDYKIVSKRQRKLTTV